LVAAGAVAGRFAGAGATGFFAAGFLEAAVFFAAGFRAAAFFAGFFMARNVHQPFAPGQWPFEPSGAGERSEPVARRDPSKSVRAERRRRAQRARREARPE
jgi:hypothetical protein